MELSVRREAVDLAEGAGEEADQPGDRGGWSGRVGGLPPARGRVGRQESLSRTTETPGAGG